jgi:glycosyltransferase involved in cell wall biosynthesis
LKKIAVMHLVDTLVLGGAELMAVNLANHLPREHYRPFLCMTRADGPLLARVRPDVTCLELARRNRFDLPAFRRLVDFVRDNDIRILHAHGSSLFIAKALNLCVPKTKLVWHAHYGRLASRTRNTLLYRLACGQATVITVNEDLAGWARNQLRVPGDRVHYLRNFVAESAEQTPQVSQLPGQQSLRVISVANIRREKDQLTLIHAFAMTIEKFPNAHLLLVGDILDREYYDLLQKAIGDLNLTSRVSFLGQRRDIFSMLRSCDVAVLSSEAEGLPMALLEYATVGLPTVATRVGQCPEVLDQGRAGILVDPKSPQQLSRGMEKLLESASLRRALGTALKTHIKENYGALTVMNQLGRIYDAILPRVIFTTPRTAIEPVLW